MKGKSKSPVKRSHSRSATPARSRGNAGVGRQKLNAVVGSPIEEKMRIHRERLGHTMDTYTMLIRSNHPIRCLEHNSAVSAFCENDNRLLCPSCLVGKSQHKLHRVLPVDKCQQQILNGTRKMEEMVEREQKALESLRGAVEGQLQRELNDTEKILKKIENHYNQAILMLQQHCDKAKARVIFKAESLKNKHSDVGFELTVLRQLYDTDRAVGLQVQKGDQQLLMYRHSLLRTIADQNRWEGMVWETGKGEVKHLGEGQLRRAHRINEFLLAEAGREER